MTTLLFYLLVCTYTQGGGRECRMDVFSTAQEMCEAEDGALGSPDAVIPTWTFQADARKTDNNGAHVMVPVKCAVVAKGTPRYGLVPL